MKICWKNFLNRKAEILDFDSLILLDKNNKTIPSNTENLNNLSGIKNSYNGEKINYIYRRSKPGIFRSRRI